MEVFCTCGKYLFDTATKIVGVDFRCYKCYHTVNGLNVHSPNKKKINIDGLKEARLLEEKQKGK